MAVTKPYKAYVSELGEVLIDYDENGFDHGCPYTTKHLTLIEEGVSSGGPELVKIHARLSAAIRRCAAHQFELFMGYLGNGIPVCNKAVMEHGDYKMIAHISNKGEVKWYVKPGYTPALDVIKIREAAAIQQNKYETWRASLSDAERYQITLDEMSCTELVAHLRAKRAERGGECNANQE